MSHVYIRMRIYKEMDIYTGTQLLTQTDTATHTTTHTATQTSTHTVNHTVTQPVTHTVTHTPSPAPLVFLKCLFPVSVRSYTILNKNLLD